MSPDPEATVRVCRHCGRPALLEPWEHRPDDPWACPPCLADITREDATRVPEWALRASRPLRAVA